MSEGRGGGRCSARISHAKLCLNPTKTSGPILGIRLLGRCFRPAEAFTPKSSSKALKPCTQDSGHSLGFRQVPGLGFKTWAFGFGLEVIWSPALPASPGFAVRLYHRWASYNMYIYIYIYIHTCICYIMEFVLKKQDTRHHCI